MATITLPNPNPVLNSGTLLYTYNVDPSTPVNINTSANTNSVSTQINSSSITSTKYVVPSNCFVGDTLTYTIILSNSGNATANNVVFIDTIPSGTSFQSNTFRINGVTIPGANPSPTAGATLPNIAPNGVTTIVFLVTVTTIPTVNPIPNNSSTNYNFLVNPITGATVPNGSNSNTATSFVNPFSNPLKIVDKQYSTVGDTLIYTIIWRNLLNSFAFNVNIIDTIPNDTTFINNSITVGGVTVPGATITPPTGLDLTTVPLNGVVTVTFQVTVNTIPSPNPIPNSTTAAYNYISDPTVGIVTRQSAESNTTSTTVNYTKLVNEIKYVDKAYSTLGDKLTYTIVFSNKGNITANNVVLLDTIPNNTAFVSDSVFINSVQQPGATTTSLNIGAIPTNTTYTVNFSVTVTSIPAPNTIPNVASASYNYYIDPVQEISTPGGINTNTVNTIINTATLASSKIVNKAFAKVGDVLTYTIPIRNYGNVTATNVVLTDTIPADTTIVPGSLSQDGVALSGSTNPPGVTLFNIPPLTTTTIVFRVKINTIPNPNPIPNIASTIFTYTIDPSTTPNTLGRSGTNTNSVTTQVNSVNLGNTLKYVDRLYGSCGDTINYKIVIPNTGNTTANNVKFFDTIPNGTTFIADSVYINDVQQLGYNPSTGITIPNISPQTTTTINFSVRVTCS